MTQRHHAKVQEALEGKKSQVDAAIKENQVHTVSCIYANSGGSSFMINRPDSENVMIKLLLSMVQVETKLRVSFRSTLILNP